MKSILLFVYLLRPFCPEPQQAAYDKAALSTLLQEQNYAEVLRRTASIPKEQMDEWLLSSTGFAAYQQGRTGAARDCYARLLDKDSNSTSALLYLGLLDKDARSWESAADYFIRLNGLRPGNSRYASLLAETFTGMKKPDSARRQLELAFLYDTTSPSLCARLGQAYLSARQYRKADSVLATGLRQYPAAGQLLAAGIQSAYFQKQHREVDALFDRLVLSGELSYPPLYYALLSQMDRKNYSRSLELFRLMQELDVATTAAYYYAARAEAALGRPAQSSALLRECIGQSVDDNVGGYYAELGGNYETQKQYAAAAACYDTAYSYSHDRSLLYRKGLVFESAGNTAAAKAAYRQYLREAAKGGAQDEAVLRYVRQYLGTAPKQ